MIVHRLRDAGLSWYARLPAKVAEVTRDRPTILLVRPDHIGDVLFLGPGLRRLRQALPDARVILAVGPWSRSAAEHLPGVDEIVTIPFPSFDRQSDRHVWDPYVEIEDWASKLRELRPWLAVILRDDDWWSALLCQRAGIGQRLGAFHTVVAPYLTDRLGLTGTHSVQRNAEAIDAAIAMLGGSPPANPVTPSSDPLSWRLENQAVDDAAKLLGVFGTDSEVVCLAPGSGAPVKLWPVDRWIAVGRALTEEFHLRIVVVGSSSEAEMANQIAAGIGGEAVSIAGKTSLPVLAATLHRARLVLGPDSGSVHLAVAVGVPTIHLFGPSSVEQFGPWGNPAEQRVIRKHMHCSECGNLSPGRPAGAGCMLAINVDDVVQQARVLLKES